ncbi:hypothetical protein DUNSADRAFT_2606 [Dunaliella salina]|uniref:Encoded protein n=1 Tax=Dunaliella salina TaxID=3046 RepID=A0ABQ7GVB9_DUNSA|nr:hypothetical protein DUNSADRAFT_2606 [Dunaliella salina]|eukprot:KAF5838544.1 hypothetical protein DUNSADRAFT_2606 [Dunaliella salina]
MRSCLTACMLCMSSLTCIPSPSAELVGPSEDSEGRPGECLSQKSTTCLVDRRNAEEKELWNKAVERRTELKRINGNLATVEKELESLKKRPAMEVEQKAFKKCQGIRVYCRRAQMKLVQKTPYPEKRHEGCALCGAWSTQEIVTSHMGPCPYDRNRKEKKASKGEYGKAAAIKDLKNEACAYMNATLASCDINASKDGKMAAIKGLNNECCAHLSSTLARCELRAVKDGEVALITGFHNVCAFECNAACCKDGKAASLKGLNNEKMDLVKKREQLAAEAVTEIRALHVTTQIRRALEQVSSHRGAAAEMHVLQTLKMANQTRYRRGAHGLWKQPVKEAVTDIFGLNELQKAHQATSRGARAHSELLVIEAVTEICTLRFTRQTRHILAQGCVHLRRHIIGILLRRHILCRKVRHAHRRRYTSRVRQTNHAGHILPHTHPTHEEASQVLTHSPNASQVNASQVLTHSPNPCEGKSNCAQSFAIPCNEYVHVYGLGHQTSMNNRQCIFSDVGQKCTALFSTRTFWQQGSRRKAYKDCKREGWALPLVKHNCTDSGLEGPRMRIDKCPKD